MESTVLKTLENAADRPLPRRSFIKGSLAAVFGLIVGPYVYRWIQSGVAGGRIDAVPTAKTAEALPVSSDSAPAFHSAPRIPSFSVHMTK